MVSSNMEAMYRAGLEEIPAEAEHIQKISRDLYDVLRSAVTSLKGSRPPPVSALSTPLYDDYLGECQ